MNIVVLGAGTAGLVTSLILHEKYPNAKITIIKSGEIGIVGVGEGSTEHWSWFMDFIGIDILELLYETGATVKIGILFKDWSSNKDFVHSVSAYSISALGRPELYHHLYLNSGDRAFPLSPMFETVYSKNRVPLLPNFKCSNQYHFDTFKLNQYLINKCIDRNIIIIDAIVTDIKLSEQGDVEEFITESENIPGDLFIDCSGFKRIISSKLGNKWISKTKYLPLNRAIAFPTELNDPLDIEPFTTSTALSAGWAWRIPTQERYGNGYVFSTDYTDSDKALGEINKLLNKNVEKAARDIKFEAGKIDKFWIKNVISVGLSSSFAEPLEAQSIGFTIIQANTLLQYLDRWPFDKAVSEKFNVEMDKIFDNVIDYLQLHYLGDRQDTKFWQDKPFVLTDFLKDNLPLFKQGIIEPSLFEDKFMFKTQNWYPILAGLNLIDKDILFKSLESNRIMYNSNNAASIQPLFDAAKNVSVITHRDYINLAKDNYFFRKTS